MISGYCLPFMRAAAWQVFDFFLNDEVGVFIFRSIFVMNRWKSWDGGVVAQEPLLILLLYK
jgi:hypothetical protein